MLSSLLLGFVVIFATIAQEIIRRPLQVQCECVDLDVPTAFPRWACGGLDLADVRAETGGVGGLLCEC